MRLERTALAVTLAAVIAVATPSASDASGFPGQGSAADWSDALPYYNRGNRYINEGRFADAVSDFQTAIRKYPYDADFYVNLGVAERKLDDYSAAEQAYRQALKLNDKDWTAWSNLGNALLKQNRLLETVDAFQHALKCNPPAADQAHLKGDIADIRKVLKNLGQLPEDKQSSAKATVPARGKAKPAAKPASAKPAAAPKATPAPSKDWGYDQ